MNKEELPTDPAIELENVPEAVSEHSEDEIFKAFLRRYGFMLFFIMAAVIAFVATSKQKEEATYTANEAATTLMIDAYAKFDEKKYEDTRKKCQEILDHPEGKASPLAFYAEFLSIKTHVVEAQQKLAKDGTAPEAALKLVEGFIAKHKSGKNSAQIECLNFARLAQACLLEDLGRDAEAGAAYKTIDINSDAYQRANGFSDDNSLNSRKTLWNEHLKAIKTP